jgi:hypothetical protein
MLRGAEPAQGQMGVHGAILAQRLAVRGWGGQAAALPHVTAVRVLWAALLPPLQKPWSSCTPGSALSSV